MARHGVNALMCIKYKNQTEEKKLTPFNVSGIRFVRRKDFETMVGLLPACISLL